MSRQSKLLKKAKLSKAHKGEMKGKDKVEKPKCPHQQPKASWMVPKKGKKKELR